MNEYALRYPSDRTLCERAHVRRTCFPTDVLCLSRWILICEVVYAPRYPSDRTLCERAHVMFNMGWNSCRVLLAMMATHVLYALYGVVCGMVTIRNVFSCASDGAIGCWPSAPCARGQACCAFEPVGPIWPVGPIGPISSSA